MGSRFRVFLPAARPPAAAGRMASAARVSMAIWRGRKRPPDRPPDLTTRGGGGAGGPPGRPPAGGGCRGAGGPPAHAPPSAKALCGLVRKQPGRSIFRIRNLSMNGQEAVLFPVSLSLSISPQEADAGTALTLKAVAECPEQYDLSGDPVLFLDATGHEVGRAPLAVLEGNDFGAEITVTAPIELGEHRYSIALMPAAAPDVHTPSTK